MRFDVNRLLHRSARGQGLIEFALIVPILMLILLLALDFGRVFFGWVGLTNATRIGANYAASHPTAWGTPGNATEQANYEAQVMSDAGALNCTLPGTIPDPVFVDGTDLGDSAGVTLTCTFSLITPIVSQLLGGAVTISAESIFPVRAGLAGVAPVSTPTPSPAPTATPGPSATAAPTPRLCDVPSYVGARVNEVQSSWSAAGFTTTVVIIRPPQGNYIITAQSPAVGGQPVDCSTTILTVAGQ